MVPNVLRALAALTLLGMVVTASLAIGLSYPAYALGRQNRTGDAAAILVLWFVALPLLLLGVGTLCTWCAVVLLGRARRQRSLIFSITGLALTIAPLPFVWQRSGSEAYSLGFGRWAVANVRVGVVREWAAAQSLPLTPDSVNSRKAVGATQPITTLPAWAMGMTPSPSSVGRVRGGVVIQWGELSTWGDSRKVFIGDTEEAVPPEDPHHFYQRVIPGLWIALQSMG